MPSHCRIVGFVLRIALVAMAAACAFTVAAQAQPVDLSAYGINLSPMGIPRNRIAIG